MTPTCPRCGEPLAGYLVVISVKPDPRRRVGTRSQREHFACPTPRQIAHRRRMGRS